MFEFHGWARVRIAPDKVERGGLDDAKLAAVEAVRLAMKRFGDDDASWFDVRMTVNSMVVLAVHGRRNHRQRRVFELFRWLAVEYPDSYGLLYVHDGDCATEEDDGFINEFRAWRLVRGRLEEMSDPFLSPLVPTIDDPWDEADDWRAGPS